MTNYYNLAWDDFTEAKPLEGELLEGISGSGGCFPAGTMVRTHKGCKPIEAIVKEDLVLAYTRGGQVEFGMVIATDKHDIGTINDPLYFFYIGELCVFPKGITGNHAIYDKSTKEHKLARTFQVGDVVVDMEGHPRHITSIEIERTVTIPVYNLTVEPQHTYFVGQGVDFFRVHNGGSGKTPRTPTEADNTLQSKALARTLEVISHGPIVGLTNGAKSIYFNNTVLQNVDNTLNFGETYAAERTGTASQLPLQGFTQVEAEVIIPGTVVSYGNPIVEQLPSNNITTATITVGFPNGLWSYNSDNGDLNGNEVKYNVYVKNRISATWTLAIQQHIKDKTTSPWEITHRLYAPNGATNWDIKVLRISKDNDDAKAESTITFARLLEVTEEALSYDNIAYVGLIISASAVGNQIPVRSYDVMGILCQIPNNYNTNFRTYTGYWNGGFNTAWTDNPAWILYDLIVNEEYGINTFMNQPVEVDVWSFYEASLYNDCATWIPSSGLYWYNLLPDGEGGLEVRFLFNAVIQTQSDAWQLLHAVASNMRAILTIKGGKISLIQDRPKEYNAIVNNSNVIDGLFVYSSSEATTRATAVNCTFNDKTDRYLPRVISEEDANAKLKYGYITKDVLAFGCTSESQARRHAKWILDTEVHQPDLVTFSMSLNIVTHSVGDVVGLMDNNYISDTNDYLTGRVTDVDGTNVTLDAPVTLKLGHVYTFGVMDPSYETIFEGTISNVAGDTDNLTLMAAMPAGDYTSHEFWCYSSGYVEPRPFQILRITEQDKGKYTINAIFYDPDKYERIEQGIVVIPPSYFTGMSTTLPPVFDITFSEYFVNTGVTKDSYILVSWKWNEDRSIPDAVTYHLRWRRDGGAYTIIDDIPNKSYQLPSIVPGLYEVLIEARNAQGKRSIATFSTYAYRTVSSGSTLDPPYAFYVKGTTSNLFTGTSIPLVWLFPLSNATKTDTLLDYRLEVWTEDGLTLKNTYTIAPDAAKNGSFEYSLENNTTDFGIPQRYVQFKVYSRDLVGDLSEPAHLTCSNPVPPLLDFNVIAGYGNAYIDITAPADNDLAGFIVYRSTTESFTATTADIVYRGTNNYIALEAAVDISYYYRVAAYDSFGQDNLNISSQQFSKSYSGKVDVWIFEGLLFSANDPGTNDVSWESGSASKNGETPILLDAGTDTYVADTIYIYYSGSGSTLSTTTDLTVAVTGVMILATYHGGTDLVAGGGNAYIDGGLILANTVGANQLVVNSAIITSSIQIKDAIIKTAHIENGAIENAKIGNTIESANFSDVFHNGWKIDKEGNIKSYGALELRDSSGALIISTGSTAAVEWSKVSGTGLPENFSTYGATFGTNIGGQITSTNITTFIQSAAIQYAQMGVASVNTLTIAGNAVIVPAAYYSPGAINLQPSATLIASLVMPGQIVAYQLYITVTLDYLTQTGSDVDSYFQNAVRFLIYVNGTLYFSHFRRAGTLATALVVSMPANTVATIQLFGYQISGFPNGGHTSNRTIMAQAVMR